MSLYNILTDKVKETGIVDIIIDMKKDMDLVYLIQQRDKWAKHKRLLKQDLREASETLDELNKKLKDFCEHTDITHYNHWDNSNSYICNICSCDVQIHCDFDYRNIKRVERLLFN